VLDQFAKIPVCVGYRVNGKKTTEIPAHASGYDDIECLYEALPGWRKPTQAVTSFEKLPARAREYLNFLEKESGARIGMVSTGPDRDQTIFMEEFAAELESRSGRSAAGNSKERRGSRSSNQLLRSITSSPPCEKLSFSTSTKATVVSSRRAPASSMRSSVTRRAILRFCSVDRPFTMMIST